VASVNDRIKQFMSDMTVDVVEERVVEYIIREVHNGRKLMEVVNDPFVRNRLNEEKRAEVFENVEIIDALEEEIRATMSSPDLGFSS
jgi:hypothetical protein